MDREKVKEEFEFLEGDERVLAVLIFGSQLTEKAHERSDIDVCIVAPGADPREILERGFSSVDTEKKLRCARLRGVHPQAEALHHRGLRGDLDRDERELEDYFYSHRKLWKDQAKARGGPLSHV